MRFMEKMTKKYVNFMEKVTKICVYQRFSVLLCPIKYNGYART